MKINRKQPLRWQRRRRRGAMYVTVLAVATIVSVIGISAAHVARLHLAGARSDSERLDARLLAMSAIEHAITEFNTNPNWQTDYVSGVEYPAVPPAVNGGTFTWKLVDEGNGQRHVDGIGRVGDASCVLQVDLGRPADWLSYALLCGGDVSVGKDKKASDLTVDGAPVCSNGTFTNTAGTTTADVEAQAIVGVINGSQTAPVPRRALPNADQTFEYYVANGTPLGMAQVQRRLITPYSNPGGATNPDGIYVIDAAGASVSIRESRIVGTIVVLNASDVVITDQINWEPARPNFPALLVQGNLSIILVDGDLDEVAEGVNFNPTNSPFQSATDSAIDDKYPSAIGGIVYCTGNFIVDGNNNGYAANLSGLVIAGGSCSVEKQVRLSLQYDPIYLGDPPPGFRAGIANEISRGSWRQIPSY